MQDTSALVVDGLLVAGFGAQHSILATLRVKARARARFAIDALAWRSVESMCNVAYVVAAVALWQHVRAVVWDVHGLAASLLWVLTAASWLWYWELHLFEYDCGLAFGSTSLVSRLAGRPMPRQVPWKVGSRRWIRFPVHTAFFGMFFLLPHMTADLLVLAVVLNVYNVIGSVLYDKRLQRLSGEPYLAYQAATGLIWPPVYRSPRGAATLNMPRPVHWRRPAMHLPGLACGLVLGGLYYVVLRHAAVDLRGALMAAAIGLAGAALAGLALGRVARSDAAEWGVRQTDLSTTVAVAAAVGVVSWAGAEWLSGGHPAPFAFYLPLWFIVQYLGHVIAFLGNRAYWVRAAGQEVSWEEPVLGPAPVAGPVSS